MAARGIERVGIVGGGAAGLVTGLTLLDRFPDLEITIHEREPAAYTTLCGEGISQKTMHLFSAFDSRPHCPEAFVGASWTFPGPVEVLVNEPCYTLERATWIPAMAETFTERGGTYLTGRKVKPDEVPALARSFDLLVGADGPGSQVRKAIGGTVTTRLGIQYRIDAPWDGDRLVFITDKRYSPEYAWVFPKGEILNVGLLAEGDGEDWARLDAFCDSVGLGDAKVLKKEAYPIAFSGDVVARDNIVLTGDAAGLTNPLTKGGLAAMIHTGLVLADCLADGREGRLAGKGGATVAQAYDARVWAHPVADPSYARALDVMLRWSNRDFERATRFAPEQVVAGGGAIKDKLLLGLGMLSSPTRFRDILVLYHAMSLSKGYSW